MGDLRRRIETPIADITPDTAHAAALTLCDICNGDHDAVRQAIDMLGIRELLQ